MASCETTRIALALCLLMLSATGFSDAQQWQNYDEQLPREGSFQEQGLVAEDYGQRESEYLDSQFPNLSEAAALQQSFDQGSSRVGAVEQEQQQQQQQQQQGNGVDGRERCLLPKEGGPCRALMYNYYFNNETGNCEKFAYGGCRGNANRFPTLKECEEACLPQEETIDERK